MQFIYMPYKMQCMLMYF